MQELTSKFVAALHRLHRDEDAGPLVDLFASDATLSKIGRPRTDEGKDGARAFWQNYRETFGSIEANFRQTAVGDATAFLEWTSRGTLRNGNDFHYDGVSVLEGSGEAITAFRTYYDTGAFLGKQGGHA